MRKWHWGVLSLLWLVAVVAGAGALLVYEYTPGKSAAGVPENWSASSRIPTVPDRPTLVMFAHPKCPCTRASIGELAALMTRCQGRVNAQVVFFRPEGTAEDWAHTDLWQSAAQIPGVTVRSDEGGKEALRFQAVTSGHVVVYDTLGHLAFSGGITEARGHSGDNEGRDAVVAILNEKGGANPGTQVFGCSLRDPERKDVVLCTP